MAGIYITELRLSGGDKPNAIVNFKKGVNIITGPSNTGKTFVFECLDYMLGKSKLERKISESNGYEHVFLELEDYVGNVYTLKSDLYGGDFLLGECSVDDWETTTKEHVKLKRKHTANKTNTLSHFILSKCGLENKWIRVNQKAKKSELSLSSMRPLSLIEELKIPKVESPFLSGQHIDKTKEINVIKFLVTGVDDSALQETPSDKVIANKSGRLEMLEELIAKHELSSDTERTIEELKDQQTKLELAIDESREIADDVTERMSHYEDLRHTVLERMDSLRTSVKEQEFLSKNVSIIEKQYISDLSRLGSTLEMGAALLSIERQNCPVCEASFVPKEPTNKDICISAHAERKKIGAMLHEVGLAKAQFQSEIEEHSSEIRALQIELTNLNDLIARHFNQSFQDHLEEIDELQEKLREINEELVSRSFVSSLCKQRDELLELVTLSKTARQFEKLTIENLESVAKTMERLLIRWGYLDKDSEHRVVFSENENDFVINGEARKLAGKGYRSITHASFTLSLLIQKLGLGFCVMDSPLVTYKKPDVPIGEGISNDMATEFYSSLLEIEDDCQVIVIENEDVPLEVSRNVHHLHFTKNPEHGRYGFIPIEN